MTRQRRARLVNPAVTISATDGQRVQVVMLRNALASGSMAMTPCELSSGARMPKKTTAPNNMEAPTRIPISAPAASMMVEPSKPMVP